MDLSTLDDQQFLLQVHPDEFLVKQELLTI
jgi:hypothetical protein